MYGIVSRKEDFLLLSLSRAHKVVERRLLMCMFYKYSGMKQLDPNLPSLNTRILVQSRCEIYFSISRNISNLPPLRSTEDDGLTITDITRHIPQFVGYCTVLSEFETRLIPHISVSIITQDRFNVG